MLTRGKGVWGNNTHEPKLLSIWPGFGHSADVNIVWFWFLGRCQDGLVLIQETQEIQRLRDFI